MNLNNKQNEMKFSLRLGLLLGLIKERILILNKNANWKEIQTSLFLIKDLIDSIFSKKEKFYFIIWILILVFCLNWIYDFFTYNQIDKALQNQQSARAENLIKKRLFSSSDKNLQLRLAHSYLGLNRKEESQSIIKQVQIQDPHNPYLQTVAIVLANTLRREGHSGDAIIILEKLPLKKCANCVQELLELYTLTGRQALNERNLERATFFLNKALILAEKLKETNSSLTHRKRELARAYNLQAPELIKAKEDERAIQVLEKSSEIYANGQTYLNLAKLYAKSQDNLDNLKKALDYYSKAYSFGLIENETTSSHARVLNLLKNKMKAEGASKEEIETVSKSFKLPENVIVPVEENNNLKDAVNSDDASIIGKKEIKIPITQNDNDPVDLDIDDTQVEEKPKEIIKEEIPTQPNPAPIRKSPFAERNDSNINNPQETPINEENADSL